jgi:hypothetical protein
LDVRERVAEDAQHERRVGLAETVSDGARVNALAEE